jgi:hypothetical protein
MTVTRPLTLTESVRADQVTVGDLLELWSGNQYRVTEVVPSSSGEIIDVRTVVEFSVDPALAVGRVQNMGRRAGTIMRRISTSG